MSYNLHTKRNISVPVMRGSIVAELWLNFGLFAGKLEQFRWAEMRNPVCMLGRASFAKTAQPLRDILRDIEGIAATEAGKFMKMGGKLRLAPMQLPRCPHVLEATVGSRSFPAAIWRAPRGGSAAAIRELLQDCLSFVTRPQQGVAVADAGGVN